MGRFHSPVFSKKTIYLAFKAQRNALYRCHGNVIFWGKCDVRNLWWVLNTVAKFCVDMITLNVSKNTICLFVRKKEKLFRASLIKSRVSCLKSTTKGPAFFRKKPSSVALFFRNQVLFASNIMLIKMWTVLHMKYFCGCGFFIVIIIIA